MNDIFKELDIEITNENKKEIDKILHKIVETEYKNCSDAWKKIKAIISIIPEPLYTVSFSDRNRIEITTVINGKADVIGTTFEVSPSFNA